MINEIVLVYIDHCPYEVGDTVKSPAIDGRGTKHTFEGRGMVERVQSLRHNDYTRIDVYVRYPKSVP